jgi:hypothetical protein
MKKLIFSIFSVFFTLTGFAQQQGQDSVYLKSGSLLIGTINQSSNDEKIEIKTRDNKIHHYSMSAIFKISKHRNPENSNNSLKKNSDLTNNKSNNTDTPNEYIAENPTIKTIHSSYFIFDAGYGFGIYSQNINLLEVNLIKGYSITRNFNLGVGVGYRYYYVNQEFGKTIPLYADLRFLVNPHRSYDFLALDLGYSMKISYGLAPVGYYVSPSFNIGTKLRNSDQLLFGIGLQIQNGNINISDNLYHLVFKVGYLFNCKK